MQVRDLMTREVLTIEPGAACHEAAARMCREKIRHLPVVGEDGRLQGIVTDRDLRHHLFAESVFEKIGATSAHTLLSAYAVRDVMSAPVVTVEPDAPLEEAARLMRGRKIGSLPVVQRGRVVGILTETDLLRYIVKADEVCCPEVECIVVSYP